MRQFIKDTAGRFFDSIWVSIVLAATAGLRLFGISRYPYFENDEGTYLGRAFALINEGQPDYYTFWYDHSPVGPLQIAGWMLALEPFTWFIDNKLVVARLLMVVLAVATVRIMISIMKRFEISTPVIMLTTVLFAVSPLTIYFGRRVLLDDIMIFWVLTALLFATRKQLSMKHATFGGLAMAMAVLSKITAVIFVPIVLYLVYKSAAPKLKGMLTTIWLIASGSLVSLYLLFAVLRGEFFPGEVDPATGETAHVSLLETNLFHLSRGGESLAPWNPNSFFRQALEGSWLVKDPFLPLLLIASTGITTLLLAARRFRSRFLPLILPAMMMLLFLMRGKLVLDFYVLPFIPLGLMSLGALIEYSKDVIVSFASWLNFKKFGYTLTALVALMVTALQVIPSENKAIRADETSNQQKAVQWIIQNTTPEDTVVVDAFALPELRTNQGYGAADYFLKVEYDPSVRKENYNDDWQEVDYIMLTHEIVLHLARNDLDFVQEALSHSVLVADFSQENTKSFIDLEDNISTNGDWAQIYEVKDRSDVVLQDSWTHYNEVFIKDYGLVIDPQNKDRATSEGQAYAMLRALEERDKIRFDGIFKMTRDRFQHRENDKLFSWLWEENPSEGDARVTDHNVASDADVDIALALIEAYELWGDEFHNEQAQLLLDNIWEHLVYELPDGRLILLPLTDPDTRSGFLLFNPSYLAPYNFTKFAGFTENTEQRWAKLSSDSLRIIEELQTESSAGLVPNWAVVDVESGALQDADVIDKSDSQDFGFDALRTIWRVALYEQKIPGNDARANRILDRFGDFAIQTIDQNRTPYASFNWQTGRPTSDFQNPAMSASLELAIRASNKTVPVELKPFTLAESYNHGEGYFGEKEDKNNYYSQSITSLYFPLIAELTDFNVTEDSN